MVMTNGVRLTPRQREVVRLIQEGRRYRAVGVALGISYHTVRTHVEMIAVRIPGDIDPLRKILMLDLSKVD